MSRFSRVIIASTIAVVASLVLAGTAAAAPLQPAFDQALLGTSDSTRAWGVAVADFTGDSTPDLVAGNTTGDVVLFRGNGDGTFTNLLDVLNGPYNDAYGLTAGDFNGDGKQDFALGFSVGTAPGPDGGVYLYLGNGNGTFQYTGSAGSHVGLLVGDAGTGVRVLASADVDGDGDLDLVAGDVATTASDTADVILFRNTGNNASGQPIWAAGVPILSVAWQGFTPNPEISPYFPPRSSGVMEAFGLAFGDVDADGDADLLVTDVGNYLYVYANDGTGAFSRVNYGRISTRPYAYDRLFAAWSSQLALAAADLNGDGTVDIVTGSDATASYPAYDGKIALYLNTGLDASRRATFAGAGEIGGFGSDTRGLAIGQLNPSVDGYPDVVFGNYGSPVAELYGLFADISDTDGDGFVDRYDLLPFIPSFPRIDYNGDGSINRFDQVDLDGDGIGSVWIGDAETGYLGGDEDADGDGLNNGEDNLPFLYNPDQTDADGDGIGEVAGPWPMVTLGDPLDNRDPDGDGIPNGPFDPSWIPSFKAAKQLLMTGDTPIILRMDALGRWWQAEFTQTLADSIYMDEAAFAAKYPLNWSGTYGSGGGYTPPADLEGGKGLPLSLMLIPKFLWTDPTVVDYLNDRLSFDGFELGQHGTYHAPIQPTGPSSEMNGYDPLEMFVYMQVGQDTMLGAYDSDPDYISAGPTDPALNWTGASQPLFSFAPPYDEFDRSGAMATGLLGYGAFSSDIWVEGQARTLMPDYADQFDPYGALHAAANFMPYASDSPYYPASSPAYADYIFNGITAGQANVILLEEVNFSGTDAGDVVNNTIDPARWAEFQTMLDVVKDYPGAVHMTLGQYAMARSYDNAPTVYNPDQTDDDHDGIGDAAETALQAETAVVVAGMDTTLKARLTNLEGDPVEGRTLSFVVDENGDTTYDAASEPAGTAVTDADGWAEVSLVVSLPLGVTTTYQVSFPGDETYQPAAAVAAEVTSKHPTAIAAQDSATSAAPPDGSKKKGAFIATLTDTAADAPLAGMTVEFLIDLDRDGLIDDSEVLGTATTNASGVAWLPLPKAAGRYTVWLARFLGTAEYLPCSDEGTITGAGKK